MPQQQSCRLGVFPPSLFSAAPPVCKHTRVHTHVYTQTRTHPENQGVPLCYLTFDSVPELVVLGQIFSWGWTAQLRPCPPDCPQIWFTCSPYSTNRLAQPNPAVPKLSAPVSPVPKLYVPRLRPACPTSLPGACRTPQHIQASLPKEQGPA